MDKIGHPKLRLNIALGAALLLGLVFTACGDSTPTPATTLAATTAAVTPASTTAAPATAVSTAGVIITSQPTANVTQAISQKPVPGGIFTLASKDDFGSTDPVVGYSSQALLVQHQLHTGLLNYDNGTSLIPELAEALPAVSSDGKVFTFKLRKGLKFSNGRDLKAGDFKYSWERIFDPAMLSPYPSFFLIIQGAKEYQDSLTAGDGKVNEITGIKVLDDLTLQVTLTQADQTFLNIITLPPGSPVPGEEVSKYWDKEHKNNDFYKHDIGTGSFMLKEWTEGKGITLVRNPYYRRALEGLPYLDSIVFQTGVDETTAFLRLKNGEIDLGGIPAAEYPQLLADPILGKQVRTAPTVTVNFVFLNNQMKPFDNLKVRQAFAYIFDRKKVLKLINNRGLETGTIFPPNLPGYSKELNDAALKFDKKKAKDLLVAANFDFNQTLTFFSSDQDDTKKVNTSLVADMKDVGLKVDLKIEQSEAYFKDIGKPNTVQMGALSWYQDFPDPSDFIAPVLSCASAVEGGVNAAFYCNKDIDALELKARGIPDPKGRLAAYQQIEKKLLDDQPWIPLFNPVVTDFVGAKVGGYFYHPVWQYDLTQFFKTK